ncbi:MAG: hypothetical protein DSY57_06940 [Desulfobulbus sp.]|nr:MAG: hypothetical protein DSY57_06940 [Desulfobulbus sp.]
MHTKTLFTTSLPKKIAVCFIRKQKTDGRVGPAHRVRSELFTVGCVTRPWWFICWETAFSAFFPLLLAQRQSAHYICRQQKTEDERQKTENR